MTTLRMPARPDADGEASPRPLPWRRMAWVTWRQHRFALAGVAVLLGALAVWLWIMGLPLHHAYAAAIPATRLLARLRGARDRLQATTRLHGDKAWRPPAAGAPR